MLIFSYLQIGLHFENLLLIPKGMLFINIKYLSMTTTSIIIITILFLITIFLLVWILIVQKNPAQFQVIKESLAVFRNSLDKVDYSLKDEFQRSRDESSKVAKDNRDELGKSLGSIEGRLEKMRETIESKLKDIQVDNNAQLEKMRDTVDEKLQKTLENRITESFKVVMGQLEQVYKGLGDMQKLAVGVGDLKKVLSNVKTRGILGEFQLGSILEQFLSPDQFVRNANIKAGSTESVEFAVKLPGNENPDEPLLLAIDSKFPVEDYQRLVEIYENISDYSKEEINKAESIFDNSVRKSAKTINEKYIIPPVTTNFAIMFVPTEGLYAQILTRTGLFEQLQRDFNVTVVGPSNLVAFLSSLQMGFRTLAVQKRSSEVWNILGAVKTEFGNFEKVLDAAQRQINTASGNLEKLVGARTRAIKRKLTNVHELPTVEAERLLKLEDINPDELEKNGSYDVEPSDDE